MTASPLTRGQGQPCPSDPGIPVSPFCPVRGSLSRVQKNAVFFPAAKQQPELRVTPLGANGSVGTWVWDIPPGRRMCMWGTDGPRQVQPLSRLSRQSLSPRQDWPLWGPGRGDRDGDGAAPPPPLQIRRWSRELAAGKVGHDGKLRGVGEPREDAPSHPGSARSAQGTSCRRWDLELVQTELQERINPDLGVST